MVQKIEKKGRVMGIGVTISGMTGKGSIRHNNRSFTAKNVDRSREEQNIVFCNEPIKQVYQDIFGKALEEYNSKKTKSRDKIQDYYEHIRNGKQEKPFHEAIFQIGNLQDCACGTPSGERAAQALKEFALTFQERNPHLRVFNMVLHMDEATPHLHVDFVPVATEQKRGLPTRVSMKQALKQQGFEGLGRKQTEWKSWMEREKEVLVEIAQTHSFEIISLGGGRQHMALPEFRVAAQRLQQAQEQAVKVENELVVLEQQKQALQSSVRLLKAVDKVHTDIERIQPERTLTGAVKGVTVEQVQELKAMAIKGVATGHEVRRLKEENEKINSRIPSVNETMRRAKEVSSLKYENSQLKVENEFLQSELNYERSFSEKLQDGVFAVLDYLEEHLTDSLKPIIEKVMQLLPVRQEQSMDEPEHEHTWGGMEL